MKKSNMGNYVCRQGWADEFNKLWTVGFYGPDEKWEPESDHLIEEDATERVHYLNGGTNKALQAELKELRDREALAINIIRDAKDCIIDDNWEKITKRHLIARCHSYLEPLSVLRKALTPKEKEV